MGGFGPFGGSKCKKFRKMPKIGFLGGKMAENRPKFANLFGPHFWTQKMPIFGQKWPFLGIFEDYDHFLIISRVSLGQMGVKYDNIGHFMIPGDQKLLFSAIFDPKFAILRTP